MKFQFESQPETKRKEKLKLTIIFGIDILC